MIRIEYNKECCGCEACAQRCPQGCITMQEDAEGFLYPKINQEGCRDCGLCDRICPAMSNPMVARALASFCVKNKDDSIRAQSSSGGIFSLLANQTIKEDGVVFGARFTEDWVVVHGCTETVEGIANLRGSKYVQSKIGSVFSQAETFLKENRKVLFSGTPCQISGLIKFLQRDYDNLLTVDFICHGVPSPKVFRSYLDEKVKEYSRQQEAIIDSICFRDKEFGWKNFCLKIQFKGNFAYSPSNRRNPFMTGFLTNLFLRPSCYNCQSKGLTSGSDIMLADFWGIQDHYPVFDDDKGASFVTITTPKGLRFWKKIDSDGFEMPFATGANYQGHWNKSASMHPRRLLFFENYADNAGESLSALIDRCCRPTRQEGGRILKHRLKEGIKGLLRRMRLLTYCYNIKKALG